MVLALLAAACSMNGMTDTCAPASPNYSASSVYVVSNQNPTYSFPSPVSNQPTINGRIFKGRPIIGGLESRNTDAAHAAASYGAYGDEGLRVQATVEGVTRVNPTTVVEFSPWAPVPQQQRSPYSDSYSRAHQKMAKRAEEARQQYLRDNNYVGGVRTFVNDATLYNIPAPRPQTRIQPRGVIELAPEVPAFKSRMQVQARPATGVKVARVIRVLPKSEPRAEKAVAKAEPKVDTKAAPAKVIAAK